MFTWTINEHIELKLLERRDAEALFSVVDRDRVYLREWLPWVDKTLTASDYHAVIDMWLKQFADRQGFQAAILYDGDIVGMAGFHGIDSYNGKTSIGYWLSEGWQGKGIMTTVVRSLLHYAFEIENLNRVEIRASEANLKSRAIPERLGFKQEGIVRNGEYLYGGYADSVVYGLLKKEWQT